MRCCWQLSRFKAHFLARRVAAFSSVLAVAIYLYIASMFQSCACHLITRVTRVELTSLFRLRAAQKFVDILTPRILAVQGQLPDGWVERTTTLAELSTAADRNPDELVDLLPEGTFSWLTVVVFVSVTIDAGLTWLQLRMPDSTSLNFPNVVNMIALAVCGTFAIVQLTPPERRRRSSHAGSRRTAGRCRCRPTAA